MKILTILVALLLCISCLFSSEFDDNLQQLLEEDGKGYVKPLVTAFGSNLNSGLYNTADVLKPSILRPIRFGVNFYTMLAMVPSSDKTFETFDGNQETATVFGNKGYTSYPDGFNVSMLPLFVPQLRLGLPAGNELMVRYLPTLDFQDYGELTFLGVGLKHSIDQYIPLFPLNLAVQGAYHTLSVGELIDIKSIAVNAHASKTVLMWTIYGGIGYEETTLKAKYDYDPQNDEDDSRKVEFEVKGDNNFRMTGGFRYAILPIIHLNADYTISQYQVITIGIGFSL